MKLVDLLARELESWPDECGSITQDIDCNLITWTGINPIFDGDEWVWGSSMDGSDYGYIDEPGSELASDHSTAIITRAQWQSARDKMKGETKVTKPKANKDGWVRHRGLCSPVDGNVSVEIRTRGGEYEVCQARGFAWDADGEDQIMAYRIHAPEQAEKSIERRIIEAEQSAIAAQANHEYGNAKDSNDPRVIRDRIREIDSTVEAMEEERESLIQRLADEGFKLLRVDGKAMPKKAELDMDDWRNWLPGDQVEVTGCDHDGWLTKKDKIGTVCLDEFGDMRIEYQGGDYWCIRDNCTFKWHSRPSK